MLASAAQATEAAIKAQDIGELTKQFDAMSAAIDNLLVSGDEHLQADWQT